VHNSKKLTVVKHNDIVEAGYRLSIYENRILLTCISQIDSMGEISSDDKFIVTAQDLSDLSDLDTKSAYRHLRLAVKRLYERSVSIRLPGDRLLQTRWVSSVEYAPGSGTVELQFAQRIIPYISELRREFTQYRLKNILMFKSNYSIRIYELLIKWGGNEKEISVEWLKKQFQLEKKYTRVGDLKRKVIDIAMTEINKHSDMRVSYSQVKRGRNVIGFKFEYGLKSQPKKQAKKGFNDRVRGVAKSEIERHARVGETYHEVANRIIAMKDALLGKK